MGHNNSLIQRNSKTYAFIYFILRLKQTLPQSNDNNWKINKYKQNEPVKQHARPEKKENNKKRERNTNKRGQCIKNETGSCTTAATGTASNDSPKNYNNKKSDEDDNIQNEYFHKHVHLMVPHMCSYYSLDKPTTAKCVKT